LIDASALEWVLAFSKWYGIASHQWYYSLLWCFRYDKFWCNLRYCVLTKTLAN